MVLKFSIFVIELSLTGATLGHFNMTLIPDHAHPSPNRAPFQISHYSSTLPNFHSNWISRPTPSHSLGCLGYAKSQKPFHPVYSTFLVFQLEWVRVSSLQDIQLLPSRITLPLLHCSRASPFFLFWGLSRFWLWEFTFNVFTCWIVIWMLRDEPGWTSRIPAFVCIWYLEHFGICIQQVNMPVYIAIIFLRHLLGLLTPIQ